MAQSEVFKACLDLFKQESTLISDKGMNSNWNDSDIATMGFLCDNLINVFLVSSIDDQLKVLPHIGAIVHRSIQRCISSDLKIINIKAILSCVGCLSNSLSVLLLETNPKLGEAITLITSQEVLLKVVLLDVALFEIVKNVLQSKSTLIADEEHLSLLCLKLLHSILRAYSFTSPTSGLDNKLVNILQGNLLAQVIQSLLVFAQVKDKLSSQQSLQCLLRLIRLLHADSHQSEWRNYFPGLFSALYGLSCSGYKSGSAALSLAFTCLIEVIALVTRDSSADNQKLLESLHLIDDLQNHDRAKIALVDLISKVSMSQAVFSSDVVAPVSSNGSSSGVESVQLQQWRVDVLQRLEVHFPRAFREIVGILTPKQKIVVIGSFTNLTMGSVHFLGLRCVSEYILCFIGFLCDTVTVVRDAARSGWQAFKSHLVVQNDGGALFSQIMSGLKQKFLNSLASAARVSETSGGGGEGSALSYELKILLGLGTIAGDQLKLLAQVSRHDSDEHEPSHENPGNTGADRGVIRCLFQLCAPDLQSLKAIVLQSRLYHNSAMASAESVESGYYRLQWCSTNDDITKSHIRKVAVLMCRHGCFDEIFSQATTAVKSIQEVHKFNQYLTTTGGGIGLGHNRRLALSDSDTVAADAAENTTTVDASVKRIRAALSLAVAGIMTVNWSMFGFLRQVSQPTASVNSLSKRKCQVCGVTAGDTVKLNKCSKCKVTPVYYCCREHQLSDWPKHKLLCGQVTNQSQEAKPLEGTDLPDRYSAEDIVDPELLICSDQLKDYHVAETNTGIIPLAKANIDKTMKFFLKICHQYLQLKLTVSSMLQSSTKQTTESASGESMILSRSDAKGLVNSKYSLELVKCYAILVATAVEGIAHFAVILGQKSFEPHLQECLYPLLELLVDSDNLVKQAAKCTLERIALYMQLTSFSELVRVNLDYIVDEACAGLRSVSNASRLSSRKFGSKNRSSSKQRRMSTSFVSPSTHLIVDLVFTAIGGDLDSLTTKSGAGDDVSGTVAPMYLLKDVIFDTLENIDTLAISSVYHVSKSVKGSEKTQQLDAMLHVLQVFVHRTTAPPPLNLFPVSLRASQRFVQTIYGSGNASKWIARNSVLQNSVSVESSAELNDEPVDSEFEKLSIEEKIKYIANHRKDSQAKNTDIEADSDDDANLEDVIPAVTPAQQLLLDILHRCIYFISIPNITCTVSIVETMSAALLRLSTCQRLLLPALHQVFPALMNRMSETVQTLHDTAPRVTVQVKSNDRSLLTESKTRYFNRSDANQSIDDTATSLGSTRSTVDLSNDPVLSAEKLYLLPALCEMFSLLSLLAGDFLTLKYREELFPQVIRVLKFYHSRAWESGESTSTKPHEKLLSALQLSDLVISMKADEPIDLASQDPSNDDPSVVTSVSSRFSVHSKIKKAVLSLISQMCHLPVCGRMLSDHGQAFVWFILPLLFRQEAVEIVDLAASTLLDLAGVSRDVTTQLIEGILYSFKKPSTSATSVSAMSCKDALERWHSVTQLQQIVQHYENKDRQGVVRTLMCVPRAEGLLVVFHSDAVFMERLNGFYSKLMKL